MGTKQIRISDPAQIRNRMGEYQGKKINIVLHDGNVFVGTVVTISDTDLTITNMRQKEVLFLLAKINEIYFDTKV